MARARIDLAHPDCLRDRRGTPIDRIVIHTMQGTLAGTVAWFKTGGRDVMTAAHYCIGTEGDIVQMVPDDRAAIHAGNSEWNRRSIGIEHAGYVDDGKPPPVAMLDASARVVAKLCLTYDIPITRECIVGHVEVPRAKHTDPGQEWPWDDYMKRIWAYVASAA